MIHTFNNKVDIRNPFYGDYSIDLRNCQYLKFERSNSSYNPFIIYYMDQGGHMAEHLTGDDPEKYYQDILKNWINVRMDR